MEVLVCVKRVPATGGRITLSDDQQSIDTKFLGFTVSPHEECAVEEAVLLVEAHGGSSTILTLGPGVAIEQLRDAIAMGIDRAILLETGDEEWDPLATAAAILDAVRAEQEAGRGFDVLLFGNEAADTGDYQVGIRVAHALGLPCVTGIKRLEVSDGTATARRESASGGWEIFEVGLPAVFTVKEGINLPRYPSVPGRLRAKKKEVERIVPARLSGGLERIRLKLPPDEGSEVEILGSGSEAAAAVVEILQTLGLVDR
ncbi:MAG: electron transfer flavoprotein subunit beta/FixA family protein [Actinomycetota bacterium]